MTPKEQWIAALRSGDYKQCEGLLNVANDRFCCLGVACDLAVKAGLPITVVRNKHRVGYDETFAVMPESVRSWLGLKTNIGVYSGGSLADDNDDLGYSFAQIADIIETHQEMFT